jgi:hypothetical protein
MVISPSKLYRSGASFVAIASLFIVFPSFAYALTPEHAFVEMSGSTVVSVTATKPADGTVYGWHGGRAAPVNPTTQCFNWDGTIPTSPCNALSNIGNLNLSDIQSFYNYVANVSRPDGIYYYLWGGSTSRTYDTYIIIEKSGGVVTIDNPEVYTAIYSLTPFEVTISPSATTTFAVEYGVTEEHFVEGTEIRFQAVRQSSLQQVSKVQAWEDLTNTASTTYSIQHKIEVENFGNGSWSDVVDTTGWEQGRYTIYAEIVIPDPDEGFFSGLWGTLTDTFALAAGNPAIDADNLYRKDGTFILGTTTAYDLLVDQVQADGFDANSCNIFEFWDSNASFIGCVQMLVYPSEAQLAEMANRFNSKIMSVFPLGYITRFVEIILTTGPITPPGLTYTYGTSAPSELEGKTYSLQFWDSFYLIDDIVADNGTDKNIWDITAPFFNMVFGFGVFFIIFSDILALGMPSFGGGGSRNTRSDELSNASMTRQNKLNSTHTLDLRNPNKDRVRIRDRSGKGITGAGYRSSRYDLDLRK